MEQKSKKIPVRQCLGCNAHREKRELLRVVRSPEGVLSTDPVGKKPGRGAYICKDAACLKKARRNGRLSRNLGMPITDAVWDSLEAEFATECQSNG